MSSTLVLEQASIARFPDRLLQLVRARFILKEMKKSSAELKQQDHVSLRLMSCDWLTTLISDLISKGQQLRTSSGLMLSKTTDWTKN